MAGFSPVSGSIKKAKQNDCSFFNLPEDNKKPPLSNNKNKTTHCRNSFAPQFLKTKKLNQMKKQISVFVVTITAIVFFSCSKQEKDIPQPQSSVDQQQMSNSINPPFILIDPLEVSLSGRYEFDSNLKDRTGKLADAVPNIVNASYTADRKGNLNRALKLDGKYVVSILNVPHGLKMSLAAWVKYDNASQYPDVFAHSNSDGPSFMQAFNEYVGFNNPGLNPWIGSGPIDNKWHHLVTTTDGATVKFYVDGILKGSAASPDVYGDIVANYYLGYGAVAGKYWYGSMDDVRFYSRTLNASDVAALSKL